MDWQTKTLADARLIMHCGGDMIAREELVNIPTPPAKGARHQPYPFAEYVDMVHEAMTSHGLRVVDEAYGVSGNQQRLFGLMQLEHPSVDFAPIVGLRGSHDQTFPRAFAAGNRVFVCDNLSFSGEITVSTKQTTHVKRRLPGLIGSAVGRLPGMFAVMANNIERMRNHAITEAQGKGLIIDAVKVNALPKSQILDVADEWYCPTVEAQREEPLNLWRLHNAFTQVLTPRDEVSARKLETNRVRTIALHGLLTPLLEEAA